MPSNPFRQDRDATLHHLVGPQPDGPIIGSYAGSAIPDAVVDLDGRRYRFAGVMPRRPGGAYDVAALAEGEWIVEPGLIDRWEGIDAPRSAMRAEQPWSQLI
jgi:hypothetical protein